MSNTDGPGGAPNAGSWRKYSAVQEGLAPVVEEPGGEEELLRLLKAYPVSALPEIARTTRNHTLHRIFSMVCQRRRLEAGRPLTAGQIRQIMGGLLENPYTPTFVLVRMAEDPHLLTRLETPALVVLADHRNADDRVREAVAGRLPRLGDRRGSEDGGPGRQNPPFNPGGPDPENFHPQDLRFLTWDPGRHRAFFERQQDLIREAKERYGAGDEAGALEILWPLADSVCPIFGVRFDAGNALVRLGRPHEAIPYYRKEAEEHNHVGAHLALFHLPDGAVPEFVLTLVPPLLILLQNLHLARPVTPERAPVLMAFLRWCASDLALGRFGRPGEMLWEEEIRDRIALDLLALVQILRRGHLTLAEAIEILKRRMAAAALEPAPPAVDGGAAYPLMAEVLTAPSLPASVREADPRKAEWYLRAGIDGLMERERYAGFRRGILLDSVPQALREDLVRSVWVEFLRMTADVLFTRPDVIRRIYLIREGGFFGGVDRCLRASIALTGEGLRPFGAGDVASVIRSEGAHAVSDGIFRSLGLVPPLDEMQDRCLFLGFPAELADPESARPVIAAYRALDRALLRLTQVAEERFGAEGLLAKLDPLTPRDRMEVFHKETAKAVFKEGIPSPLDRRPAGEAIYTLLERRGGMPVPRRMRRLCERIRGFKAIVAEFPWEVRVFFDGGVFLNTWFEPFSALVAPMAPVAGGKVAADIRDSGHAEHVGGEWLHYLFRLRIRQLLCEERLAPEDLPVFYATALIYMGALPKAGAFLKKIAEVTDGFSHFRGGAVRRLIHILAPFHLEGFPGEIREELGRFRMTVVGEARLHPPRLESLLSRPELERGLGYRRDLIPMMEEMAGHIRRRMAARKPGEAAILLSSMIQRLKRELCVGYAMRLDSIFLPPGPGWDGIMETLRQWRERFADTAARDLVEVADIVRALTPEMIFEPVAQRRPNAAEPERIFLLERVRDLDRRFREGEISLGEAARLAKEYIDDDYQKLKTSKPEVALGRKIRRPWWRRVFGG